jgi:peptidoglycan/xylan/chitin deacetylase (PgdA/CDA1 family)
VNSLLEVMVERPSGRGSEAVLSRALCPGASSVLKTEGTAIVSKLRRFLHVAAAVTLHYSGALALRRRFRQKLLRRDEVCILGLHRVLTPPEQERSNSLDGMIILEDTYLALLEHLRKRFNVISLEDFLRGDGHAGLSSKPPCIITFDDGWMDTYSRAFPGLKKFKLPAVAFLATGTIGSRGGFWVEKVKKAWRHSQTRERLQFALRGCAEASARTSTDLEGIVDWLKRMPVARREAILESILSADQASSEEEVDAMLSWDQAKEMSEGGVEIGAHTVNHPLLTYEHKDAAEEEIRLSKQILESTLGTEVRAFAYPNGDWSEAVRDQVAESGYRCAFTTKPAWYAHGENAYSISRVLLHEGNITAREGKFSPAMFDLTLAGWA